MKKPLLLSVRLAEEDKKRLIENAKKKKLSVSGYIRLLLLKEEEYQEVLKYLRKILYRTVQANISIEELCCDLPLGSEKKKNAFIERVKARVANEKP